MLPLKSPGENKETERLVDAEENSVDDDTVVAVLSELEMFGLYSQLA